MSNGRITTTRDRIEQAWSRGLLPDEIALRLGVRLAEVLRVGEAMDAAALQKDEPRWEKCPAGHRIEHGARSCVPCKNKQRRETRAARKANA